jgi:hypothetical protein
MNIGAVWIFDSSLEISFFFWRNRSEGQGKETREYKKEESEKETNACLLK